MAMGELENMLSTTLEGIFDQESRTPFPPHNLWNTDVRERYNCSRTFLRASYTRAIEINVSEKDFNAVKSGRKV